MKRKILDFNSNGGLSDTYDNLMVFLLEATEYKSVLKGIPFSEDNVHLAKQVVRRFNKCSLDKIYVKYRGPRPVNPNHTLKRHATHFDVYRRTTC